MLIGASSLLFAVRMLVTSKHVGANLNNSARYAAVRVTLPSSSSRLKVSDDPAGPAHNQMLRSSKRVWQLERLCSQKSATFHSPSKPNLVRSSA